MNRFRIVLLVGEVAIIEGPLPGSNSPADGLAYRLCWLQNTHSLHDPQHPWERGVPIGGNTSDLLALAELIGAAGRMLRQQGSK